MNAAIKIVVTFIRWGFGLGLSWNAWQQGHTGFALFWLVLAASVFAIILLPGHLMAYRGGQREGCRPLSLREWLRSWLLETWYCERIFVWEQAFRSLSCADYLPAHSEQRGVLLVHGFLCNRGFWNQWMPRLRAQSTPYAAITLEPTFGSIDDYPAIIEAAMVKLEACTGKPPILVAHSMGGLAIRAWAAQKPGNIERVHSVLALGSPHYGTYLAKLAFTPNGQQMRRHSQWLKKLASTENHQTGQKFTCYFSASDNIVSPPSSACLSGAQYIDCTGAGHVTLAYLAQPYEELCRQLAAVAAKPVDGV